MVRNYYTERGVDLAKVSVKAAVNGGWELPGFLTDLTGAKGGGDISGHAGREWGNQSVADYVNSTLLKKATTAVEKARANGANDIMAGRAAQSALVTNAKSFMNYGAGKTSVRRSFELIEKAKTLLDKVIGEEIESPSTLSQDYADIETFVNKRYSGGDKSGDKSIDQKKIRGGITGSWDPVDKE